jgi:tetracycline 7-halogenase / FADH2 O2-dependent halogenase
MINLDVDVAIIGAGFGGSLTALVLDRLGLRPALIERGAHPRFALGESSTPLADLLLGELARRYDLPRLAPLAEYGTWQQAYPELPCGLKRGFSYFHHQAGQPFAPRADHANELLVAASRAAADADLHWLRADFDQFLVNEAQAAGVPYLDRTELTEVVAGPRWTLLGRRGDEPCRVTAAFIVDASGEGGVLARQLGISCAPDEMRTNSRVVYGHFRDVRPWREILAMHGARLADHTFPCDAAALHHVFDGGWMYVLRFDQGVTSAGFLFDAARHPIDAAVPAIDEWRRWLARFPSIAEQFDQARVVAPEGGVRRTGRLQRRARCTAGANWAMLPATAYTLDALHSTGNAHTLHGIERLARALARTWDRPELADEMSEYDRILQAEISLADRLVHGCYQAFGRFELMAAFTMFYFAAAHTCEERRRRGQPAEAFLLATEAAYCEGLGRCYEHLLDLTSRGAVDDADVARFEREVADAVRAFNTAGLCDASRRNMYACLAT